MSWLLILVLVVHVSDTRVTRSWPRGYEDAQLSSVVSFINNVQQYLVRVSKEEARSRSLLSDHIPCAKNMIRGRDKNKL